jgi:hypothetical protein
LRYTIFRDDVIAAVALLVMSACKGAPARLVAGIADTVVVNNRRAVQLPVRVLDAAGHVLPATGVRYRWTAGAPVSVSAAGVVTCTQPGDATVRASLGHLATDLILRCRPVQDVRGTRMMNLVVGDPAQDVPFEAVDVDGRPVTMLTGQVSVGDSTIATLDGLHIRARAPGATDVTMRVGDREGFMSVHTYERVRTPEGIRPGQHWAIAVRLAGGEMRQWRISASPEAYFLTMLPDRDEQHLPRLAIIGAVCSHGLDAESFFCLAQHDASVIVYHPQQVEPAREWSGTLAVWRQEHP